MPFQYTSIQIGEIVRAEKVLRRPEALVEVETLPFTSCGTKGKRLDLILDFADGPPVDLRFHVRAGIFDNPETFEAALILSQERVRGVGWHATGKKRHYGKQVIPKGWHQNVIDPNLPLDSADFNRHLPLPNFDPADLNAFFIATARLWHIDLTFAEGLL